MTSLTPGQRIEAALGRLLLRGNRMYLYERLVEGIDGVDATTYPVLSGVARTGPTSATRLASAIGLDRTATTRYATRLESAGLLRRTPDPDDARATHLELTGEGRAAVAAARDALGSAFAELMADWAEADAECFAAGLERFTTRLENRQRPTDPGSGEPSPT
jgi:DNA-binding MarR family transcriptional regulator